MEDNTILEVREMHKDRPPNQSRKEGHRIVGYYINKKTPSHYDWGNLL